MRLFRDNMARIPYSAPSNSDGVDWLIRCVQKMTLSRKMLYEGIRMFDDKGKVASSVVEKLRRGTWTLTGKDWQKDESNANNDDTSVILSEEQDGNWVIVKQLTSASTFHNVSSVNEVTVLKEYRIPSASIVTKPHMMKPFFESLLYVSACLQYAIDQYVYSLYCIDIEHQLALEKELKLEFCEKIMIKYPRIGNRELELKGLVPDWGEKLISEVRDLIENKLGKNS
jgi:hypothetical protein